MLNASSFSHVPEESFTVWIR